MINQLYDIHLHRLSRHTNMMMPYCKYISADKFPDQISELLNTEVTLKYRNHNWIDNVNIESTSRPSDDYPWTPKGEDSPEFSGDQHDVYEDKFVVLRADATPPYRLIARSRDYKIILINSTDIDEGTGEYKFRSYVSEYAVQNYQLYYLDISDQYAGEISELKAVTLRVDAGEPTYSVLVEYLGNTGYIRFVLGDEVFSNLLDRIDPKGDYDYDNRSAADFADPVDVDGFTANHYNINHIKNIDGGNAANFWHVLHDPRAGEGPPEFDQDIYIEPDQPSQVPDFGDLDDALEDEGYYNFGLMEVDRTETAYGDFNFKTIEDDPEDTDIYIEPNPSKPPITIEDTPDFDDIDEPDEEPPTHGYVQRTVAVTETESSVVGEGEEYNFYDVDEDPPVIGPDDGVYNFGDEDEMDETAEGNYDFLDIDDDENLYDGKRYVMVIWDDITGDDEGYYNFGYLDMIGTETAKGDFNFGTIEDDPLDTDIEDPDAEPEPEPEEEPPFEFPPLKELTEEDKAFIFKKLIEGKTIYGTISGELAG